MNSAALGARIEELRAIERNLDRLDSFLTSLRAKTQSKAERFGAVQLCGAWTGAAAREFEDELRRTQKAAESASGAIQGARAVIMAEKARVFAQIVVAKGELAVAVALEAAQRAAAQKGTP